LPGFAENNAGLEALECCPCLHGQAAEGHMTGQKKPGSVYARHGKARPGGRSAQGASGASLAACRALGSCGSLEACRHWTPGPACTKRAPCTAAGHMGGCHRPAFALRRKTASPRIWASPSCRVAGEAAFPSWSQE
jgi:hypothetical protein